MNGQESQPQGAPYYNVNPAPTPAKRKNDEEPPPSGQRAKRNRYISIACNECKRRKIKCNGQNPCGRCGHLSLECVYAPNCCSSGFKDSEEYRSMTNQIQVLQDQVNDLYNVVAALRAGHPYPVAPNMPQNESPVPYRGPMSPSRPRPSHNQFQGPTSSAYNFDVAKSSLQTMGIAEPEIQEEGAGVDIDPALGAPHQQQAPMAPMVTRSHKDPLWQLNKTQAIELCKIYDEEMGIMYPMLDANKLIDQTAALYDFIDHANRSGLMQQDLPDPDQMGAYDVNIVKMVIATALTVREFGNSELGRAICESCREAWESSVTQPVEIKGLILLVLVAEFFFQQDDENQAHRFIKLATQLCLEIGLHRRESLLKNFPHKEERSWVVKLFWSIYVLDRRWSFGVGQPFALQDSDIDPNLPQPDDSNPYMTAMISYSQIASKVYSATISFESSSTEIDIDKIFRLDLEISQWTETIPHSLRYNPSDEPMGGRHANRGQQRLQVILFLRTNLMRSQLYRPVLHSATSIMENKTYAQTVVDIAKDTIRTLKRLNDTTDIYRSQQVCFNYFLLAALAVLWLAVSHAPNEFSQQVRDEFYQAVELVDGFRNKSYVARRLWRTIRTLKELGPKLGLVSRQTKLTNANDPHSSAAVAMAGLAGHHVDEIAAYASAQNSSSLGSSPLNGQMSYELTNLFEAAVGHAQPNPHIVEGTNGYAPRRDNSVDLAHGQEGFSGVYGNEGEFSRIVGDLI